MEARPADLVLVDESNLEPELGRPKGRRVTAGAGAEHDEIEVVGRADGHGISVPRGPRTGARATTGWAGGSCATMVRGPSPNPQPRRGRGPFIRRSFCASAGARLAAKSARL